MHCKYLSLIVFSLLGIHNAYAALDSYTITRTTGITYTDITTTGGTAISSWRNGTSADENLSQTLNIGFTFYFDGSPQTQFRVSTNGFLTFNTSTNATGSFQPACGSGDAYSGDNTIFSIPGTKGSISAIAPFYDDLIVNGFSLNSSMHNQVSGVAPDRVLTVQWRGMSKYVNTSNCSSSCSYGNYNFQIKLHETSGNIEFIYGTMSSGSDEDTKNYSCGINSASMTSSPATTQVLSQQTANSATFTNNHISNLSSLPTAASMISFTRTAPTPASGVPTCINYNFPANGATNQCVNSIISWSACDGVPTVYDVYFGTASNPPSFASDVMGNFYNLGTLLNSTTYYWKIIPKNSFGVANIANISSFTTGTGDVVNSITSSLGNTICAGATANLTVNGSLSEGSVYNWTAPFLINLGCKTNPPYPLFGNCAASSRNFSSNSAGSQRFDVFARGCNGTSSCATLTITVLANSTAPTSISSSAGNSFCGGTPTTLTANGGTHAGGAQYAWYSGSCGGTPISTGSSASITVTPIANTTYYVRREGTCPAATTCASISITIQSPAVGNNVISGEQMVCPGQTPNTLSGSLPTGGNIFTYQWESSTTSSSSGYTPISGSNIQNYSPGAISVITWFRRNVIQVDGCTASSTSNPVQVGIGPGQCDDSNPCTQDVCNGNACKNICTLQISNPNSTKVSIQGCNDGTVSANVGFATCTEQWNAILYSGNIIQKSWTSAQGAQVLWDNVPAGNYLLVASNSPECIDSADISVGITLSCNISVNNLVAASTSVQGCSDGTISATINATVCNGQWFATLFDNANATIKIWNYQLGSSITWNGIAAGSYRIFVTDNKACSINQNVTVTNGPPCSIQIQNLQTSILDCDNNSITASIAALTCNNTWSAYLYSSDYSELLKTWSNQQGSTITWTEVSLDSYHIFATNFSGCSDTLDVTLDCSDNNSCTNDNCASGCSHSPKCNDNNSCTTDICQNGQCTYQPIICNDNNPCTIDNCLGGNCVFTPRNCNDNEPCTTDNCTGGVCTHTNNCGLTISGFIKTETGTAINGATVIISGTISDTVVIGSSGSYSFGVIQGGNYTITPSKGNDIVTNNGVTTADITIMRRHVLTNNFITSPYKIIAADANNSGTVSTADIAFVRRVVLSNTATFPITTSPLVYGRLWSFISSSQVFSGPPYNPFPFVKTRTYPNLLTSQTNQNFIGVKVGDVNGSWNSTIP